MAAVAESQRIAELRRLGAFEPLVRLASGDCVHETFRNSCLGPPYYVYHMAGTPAGTPLVPALRRALAELGRDDILVVGGGVIPPQDYDELYKDGVVAIFGPGTVIPQAALRVLDALEAKTQQEQPAGAP